MNTPLTAETDEVARLEKLRAQLSSDIETMHQKEASLREYETKLRALVDHANSTATTPAQPVQSVQSSQGPATQAALDTEWEKYQRANALLEAARRALTDDRLALRDREEKVMIREQEVARREAWVKAREQQLIQRAEADAAAAAAAAAAIKARPSFTAAPFLAARNLLHLGKNS